MTLGKQGVGAHDFPLSHQGREEKRLLSSTLSKLSCSKRLVGEGEKSTPLRLRPAERQPARNRGPVGAVILAEAPLEAGLFNVREVELEEDGEQQGVDAQARRVEPQGLGERHGEQAERHGVLE